MTICRECGMDEESPAGVQLHEFGCPGEVAFEEPAPGMEWPPEDSMDAPVDAAVDAISDLAAGTAAEHLVCADLLLSGYRAFLADQNCPYDVAVEQGGRLIRIQVKATRGPRRIPQRVNHRSAYLFQARRAGKAGRRRYADGDFDVLALVALDIRRIAYIPFSGLRDAILIRVPGVVYGGKNAIGRQFDELTFEGAVR